MIEPRAQRLGAAVADSQAHSFFIIATIGGDHSR
jgi:hypothetical protein